MPTMKDVAKKAGVSLGTVSNVLNNRNTVLPQNRDKVLKAVEDLGFQANMVARTLKTKASNDIGLIIPDISNPFYPEFARGVEDAAQKAGLTVFLCNDDRDAEKEHGYISSLVTKNVSGIIVVKPQSALPDIIKLCHSTEVIFVDVDIPLSGHYNVVNVDDLGGIMQGMAHLYENGHRKIAFVSGLLESPSSQNRKKAYLQFMEDKQLDVPECYVEQGNYSWESGFAAGQRLMALPGRPTAIFAANDLMAIGCMKAIQAAGLNVPGDVSVLGYDNIVMSNLCTPALSTIDQPKYRMGAVSVEMLLRRIETGAYRERLELPTHVVQRESVAPYGE